MQVMECADRRLLDEWMANCVKRHARRSLSPAGLRHPAPNLPSRLTGELGKVRCADVCSVAVGTDQDPTSVGCDDLGRMATMQMIEEPAAVIEPAVGHSIARMQASDRDAGRKGAGSVVQG